MFDYVMVVKNEIALLPLHFDSLYKYENVDFPIYIVIVGDNKQVADFFLNKNMTVYHIPEYGKTEFKGFDLRTPYCYESAYASDWAMVSCGSNEWTILVHPDTTYMGSGTFNALRSLMENPQVGAIGGVGLGFFAVRKKAYQSCDIGFATLMSVRLLPHTEGGEFCLRTAKDPRLVGVGKPIRVLGLDVAQLFIMDMLDRGWQYEILHGPISRLVPHSGSGSRNGGYT
jgi:hypothetical protein